MEQYIQKAGTDAPVTMSSLGFKDLQSAANAGYSPVAAPKAVAPTVPAPTVNTPTANTINSNSLSPDLTVEAKNRDTILQKVKDTYNKVGGDTLANEAFIQGVTRAKYGRAASVDELAKMGTNPNALMGASVNDVLKKFGLLDKMDNYGLTKPVEPSNSGKNGTSNTGNGQTGDNSQVTADTPQKSALDQKMDMVNNWSANKATAKASEMTEHKVDDIQTKITEAQTTANNLLAKIETAKSGQEAEDILNEEAMIALKAKIEGQPILLSAINAQLLKGSQDLSQQQRLKRLYDTYDLNTQINQYNSQLRNVQLLQGQYENAMNSVKEGVDDWTEEQNLKLQILEEQGQLEKEEKTRYEAEINYERGLMQEGYTYIQDTATYEKIVKELGVTAGTFSQFFYKDPANGKIYLKPNATDNTLLTVAEAKALGVPYGTTKKQASQMNITPGTRSSGSGGGSGSGVSGGTNGKVSNLTQSIIDNPSLFDDLTATNKGKVLEELQSAGYDTSNLGTKALSDTAIGEITQTEKALSDLKGLIDIVQNNQEYIGPISGWQKLNPWSKAKQIQADINRVKQTVGKALEGGVLRKEDEDKYKQILATILDTPETALYKLDQIYGSITQQLATYKTTQQASGRSLNVKQSLQKKNINSNNTSRPSLSSFEK